MRFRVLLLLSTSIFSIVTAAPLRRDNTTDSDVGFFDTASNASTSGQILRSRTLTEEQIYALNFTVPLTGYQYLYSTYDSINKEEYTTPATVLVPKLQGVYPIINTHPFLIYALAYDSASKECGPSYQIAEKKFHTAEGLFIQQALLAGITVVLPDYEGPRGAFNVGPLSGPAFLDSIRAVLSFKEVVPDKSKAKIVLKGYSGGSVPVAWALQEQHSYAPELQPYIKGASMGGMPTMPADTLKALDGGPFSTLVLSALTAYTNVFKQVRSWVDARVTPKGKTLLSAAEQLCTSDNVTAYQNMSIFKEVVGLSADQAIVDPTIKPILDSLILANGNNFGIPQVPLYVYSSKQDDVVPHRETQRYVDQLWSHNVTSLEYTQVVLLCHVATDLLVGPTDAFEFINSRFAGIPPAQGCNSTLLNPPANSNHSQ